MINSHIIFWLAEVEGSPVSFSLNIMNNVLIQPDLTGDGCNFLLRMFLDVLKEVWPVKIWSYNTT